MEKVFDIKKDCETDWSNLCRIMKKHAMETMNLTSEEHDKLVEKVVEFISHSESLDWKDK